MVKTVRYTDPTYVGDPVNVINLFNRFEVDEIALLNIRATVDGTAMPFALMEELASECWVPLSYGGGISNLEQVRQILGLGIEKVVLGTAAADQPELIRTVAETFGSQAVVVSVDAMQTRAGGYDVVVESATRYLGVDPVVYALRMAAMGAGEILLNAVHRDGTMAGYDLALIDVVSHAVDIPVIACGGAGDRRDLATPLLAGASAVGAGSLFVFQGRARSVLVNFPERGALEAMLEPALRHRAEAQAQVNTARSDSTTRPTPLSPRPG